MWLESSETRGADDKNLIKSRDITIELYFETESDAEAKIEVLLNALPVEFSKDTVWLDSEKMYETIYNFELEENYERRKNKGNHCTRQRQDIRQGIHGKCYSLKCQRLYLT